MFRKQTFNLLILFLFFVLNSFSQDRFHFQNDKKSHTISFKIANGLIVIPVEVNGSPLNFLLDTGVNNTLIFNLSAADSTNLKNTEKIKIRGLGEGNYIDAIRSQDNFVSIGKLVNGHHKIYLIPGKEFDLSARLGMDINGIIGGDLFRDVIVDINYSSNRIKFYNPNDYSYKPCKTCEVFDLSFYKNKPYIDIQVKDRDKIIDTKLLIDTGGGKTLWLFDKSSEDIRLPDRYFQDFLGKGLSGNIFGRRAKIDEILLGHYSFKKANVAYPDSSSIATAYDFKERNGSLGSGILKRFRLVINYKDKKLVFKKKSKYFNEPFLYNKSGMDVIHAGQMMVGEKKGVGDGFTLTSSDDSAKPIVQILYELVYDFKPVYMISYIREDSPASKAGLREKDIVLQINGKAAYNYKLEEIIHILSEEAGKRINILVERNGVKMYYFFYLEDLLE